MKNFLIVFSVVLVTIVSSCQKAPKNEVVNDPAKEVPVELTTKSFSSGSQLRRDITQYPIEDQKALYRSLNPYQMSLVWEDKLNQAMAYEGWNNYQLEILTELKEKITPGLFNNSTQANTIREQIQDIWLVKAKGQFVFDDLMKIVSVLDDYAPGIIVAGGGSRPKKDCECSTKSDWCSTTLHQHCELDKDCTDSAHGCGTLWLAACRGMCKL